MGARAAGIVLPPPRPGWDILIVQQQPVPGLALPARPDVTLLALPGRGLSASRNAALAAAQGDLMLVSDDDMLPDADGIAALAAHLAAHPDLALVAGQRRGVARAYPAAPHPLRRRNAARIASPELMLRLAPVRAAGLRFDTRFGLGTALPLGEEFIFVTDALRAGLRGVYLPLAVGTHPPVSSGDDWDDPVRTRARAAALQRVFGRAVAPWALAFALRHWRDLGGLAGVSGFVPGGAAPALTAALYLGRAPA